jgi:predicted Zn finger-like uncharacterized protein
MALATQCPHCHTTFRVAHDQLKLRAGLVRCGACKQIFNGIENLLRPELQPGAPAPASSAPVPATPFGEAPPATRFGQPTTAPAPAPDTEENRSAGPNADFYLPEEEEEATEQAATSAETRPALETETEAETEPETGTGPEAEGESEIESDDESGLRPPLPPASDAAPQAEEEDPMLRMTLMDFSEQETGFPPGTAVEWQPDRPDPLDRAMEDLERKPLRGSLHDMAAGSDSLSDSNAEQDESDADYEEPDFVRQGRRRQRRGRALRSAMAGISLLLLLVLLAQSAYVFRDQLAARFPQTKPVLLEVCAYLDCQVGLPAQIDMVSIESSELQTLAPNSNTLVLTILLRNHGAIAQAWPHLELSLNDTSEKAQVRRVFAPAEYLPRDVNPRLGFPSRGEQPVRLFFELDEITASGYRVYLFYP